MRKVALCLFGFFIIMATSAAAQSPIPKPISVYLGGGISVPTSDLQDLWNLGFHGSAQVGLKLGGGPAPIKPELIAEAEYHSFSFDDMDLDISGGTFSSILIGGGAKINFTFPQSPITAALLGSIGAAVVDVSALEGGSIRIAFESDTRIYFSVGGVLEVQKFFLRARYVNIDSDGATLAFIPLTAGIKF